MKVLTIHDLEAIKKRAENALLLREQSNEAVAEQCCGLAAGTEHLQILICGGTDARHPPAMSSLKNFSRHSRKTRLPTR